MYLFEEDGKDTNSKDEISHHSEELKNGSKSDDDSSSSSISSEGDPKKDGPKNYDNDVNDETFANFEPVIGSMGSMEGGPTGSMEGVAEPVDSPTIIVTPPVEEVKKEEFVIPSNFVLEYLKKNYEEYYGELINELRTKFNKTGKNEHGYNANANANWNHNTNSNMSVSSAGSTSKKIEYDFPVVKSKGEEEAENLANMCVIHAKYDEMIKNPIEVKIKNGHTIVNLGNSNNSGDINRISTDPEKMYPDEYKIVMDNITFIQNRITGRASLITKHDANTTTSYEYFSSTPSKHIRDDNYEFLQNSAIQKVPINIRKKIAAYKLAEKLRHPDMNIEVRKFGWNLANEKNKSLIEKFLSTQNWALPKTMVLAEKLNIPSTLCTLIRKIAAEINKDFGI
jgi:hypothetical protein